MFANIKIMLYICSIQLKQKIMTTTNTMFRLDKYNNGSGNFMGFYSDVEEAQMEMDNYSELSEYDSEPEYGKYYQVTKFKVHPEYTDMMKEWQNGEIVSTRYFAE